MCNFKYDAFDCGCQRYHFSGFEPCDAYRRTGNSLALSITFLIPRTEEHDDIAKNINWVQYQTMPQDTNILFEWHRCKEQTYVPLPVRDPKKDPCPWHLGGNKEICLREKRQREKVGLKHEREKSMEKRQREKTSVRYGREKPREKKQGLEKKDGCVVQ